MTDTVDSETRSRIMRAVPQKNTKPELLLRRALHKLGLRFRVNVARLPGTPDIVLPKYNTVIFVHGCYWHRHGCDKSTTPKSNANFWERKFSSNRQRDTKNVKELRQLGWRVMTVWECEMVGKRSRSSLLVAKCVRAWLQTKQTTGELPSQEEVEKALNVTSDILVPK